MLLLRVIRLGVYIMIRWLYFYCHSSYCFNDCVSNRLLMYIIWYFIETIPSSSVEVVYIIFSICCWVTTSSFIDINVIIIITQWRLHCDIIGLFLLLGYFYCFKYRPKSTTTHTSYIDILYRHINIYIHTHNLHNHHCSSCISCGNSSFS